jgi:hypothetical protein
MLRKAILASLGFVLLASVALAGNAHFLAGTDFSIQGSSLTATGRIAGLGNQDVTLVLSADAVSYCTNQGGNNPPGQAERVSATLSNLHPENGSLTFTITASATKKCPGRQAPTVTFSNATISVYQNGSLVLQQTFNP